MDLSNVTNLLWWLVVGGLFYWMMRRGGCGMHGGHSHGRHNQHAAGHGISDAPEASHGGSVRDPVCGMTVERDRAAGMRKALGQTFYLCSARCLEKFDREPEAYARRVRDAESSEAETQGGPIARRGS